MIEVSVWTAVEANSMDVALYYYLYTAVKVIQYSEHTREIPPL